MEDELLKYKNAKEFADAHGKKKEVSADEISASKGGALKELAKLGLSIAADKIKTELDPFGIFYSASDELKAHGKLMDARAEHDKTRPGIPESLKFSPVPSNKVEVKKSMLGFLKSDWTRFCEEVEAGRAKVAEAVVLDVENAGSASRESYYVKIADLDGNVLKDQVHKMVSTRIGYDTYKLGGWLYPGDYEDKYPGRTDEEYKLYAAVYMVNTCADKVDIADRPRGYVLYYNIKNKDHYAFLTREEYDDLKKIKDDVSLFYPEYCFKPEITHTFDFDW